MFSCWPSGEEFDVRIHHSVFVIIAAGVLFFIATAMITPLARAQGIPQSVLGLEAQESQEKPVDTGSASQFETTNYLGITKGTHYDVSFRNGSLREVLQFLSWIAEINIMIPEGVEGVVNVHFRDITIGDSLNSIIKANQLEYTLEGSVIRIGKEEQFKDTGEDLKAETIRLRFATASDMAGKVKTMLTSRGSVISDQRTNSIVVREYPGNIDNVRRFIKDIDIKDAQVLIEAKLLEATRSFSRDLGLQWGVNSGSATSKFRVGGVNAVGTSDSGQNLNTNLFGGTPTSGLLIGSLVRGANIDVQILAAEQRGDVYVISDPSIVTSNGQAANIRSGATLLIQGSGDVNIGSGGTTGGTTSGSTGTSTGGIVEKETGVELTVTPQITVDDFIKLQIKTTTSTPDFSRAVQGIPIIVDNVATTTVLVKDGETTVIGGLSRFTDNLGKQRVPFFSRIPVLGNLFRSRSRNKENTEMMVFIKPTVIRVEGISPAQTRVRDMEQRRENMTLTPLEDAEKINEERREKTKRTEDVRGNKYVR